MSRSKMRRLGSAAALAALLAAGCKDGFFAPSAPALGSAGMRISYQFVPGESGGAAEAFDKADSVRVELWRGDVAALDSTLALPAPGSTRPVQVSIEMEQPEEPFLLVLELRAGAAPIFSAESEVVLRQGEVVTATPGLVPIAAEIHVEDRYGPLTAIGDSLRLSAHALFATGDTIAGAPLTWEILDPDVISLTPAGVAEALAEGEARVRVTSGELSAESVVEVRATEAEIEIVPEQIELEVGDSARITAIVHDVNGNPLPRTAQFSSADETVATVDGTGMVRAVGEGETTIEAQAGSAPPATVPVIVSRVPVGSVIVTPDSVGLLVGSTVQLSARVEAADGSVLPGRPVGWASTDTSIARVSADGLVTAVRAGVVDITATSEGQSGQARVTVQNPTPVGNAISPASTTASTDGLTITITGTGFVTSTQALWEGEERPTTYVSPAELRVQLQPGDLRLPGSYVVDIASPGPGGGEAEPLVFSVDRATPFVETLPPSAIGETDVVLAGSIDAAGLDYEYAFLFSASPDSVASIQPGVEFTPGSGAGTVTQLVEGLGSGLEYFYQLVVVGESIDTTYGGVQSFETVNNTPVVEDIAPDTVFTNDPFTLTVLGSNFHPGLIIAIGEMTLQTTFISETEVSGQVLSGFLEVEGVYPVAVVDPDTNEFSNSVDLTVLPEPQ